MTSELTESFAHLFRGRTDIYGGDKGVMLKGAPPYERHLKGQESIGVYPLMQWDMRKPPTHAQVPVPTVAWGCSDIDNTKLGLDASDPTLALNLWRTFQVLGIWGYVEVSKSKGYHVWVFVKDWVEAEVMRNAFLLAHQVAGVPPTEVNPKSVDGGPSGNGNYVRLPYPGGLYGAPERQYVIYPKAVGDRTFGVMSLPAFVTSAKETCNGNEAALRTAAGLYVPPPPVVHVLRDGFELPVGLLVPADLPERSGDLPERHPGRKLSGYGWTIYRQGPSEGYSRGLALLTLAYECKDSGLTPEEAWYVLCDADLRWGKYLLGLDGHKNGERYIMDKLDQAYGS